MDLTAANNSSSKQQQLPLVTGAAHQQTPEDMSSLNSNEKWQTASTPKVTSKSATATSIQQQPRQVQQQPRQFSNSYVDFSFRIILLQVTPIDHTAFQRTVSDVALSSWADITGSVGCCWREIRESKILQRLLRWTESISLALGATYIPLSL